MRRLVVIVFAATMLWACAARAAQVSFGGACSFASTALRSDREVGFGEPVQVNSALAGTGECTGALDSQPITSAASFLTGQVSGKFTCSSGTVGALTGSGVVEIAGKSLPVNISLTGSTVEFSDHIDLQGASGGSASGDGRVAVPASGSPNEGSEGGIVGCPKGTNRQNAFDVNFTTASPLLGGTPDPPATPVTAVRFTAPAQRASTVRRRRYVSARLSAPASAPLLTRVLHQDEVIARGSVRTGGTIVRARLTSAGRRFLRHRGPMRILLTASGVRTQVLVLR